MPENGMNQVMEEISEVLMKSSVCPTEQAAGLVMMFSMLVAAQEKLNIEDSKEIALAATLAAQKKARRMTAARASSSAINDDLQQQVKQLLKELKPENN